MDCWVSRSDNCFSWIIIFFPVIPAGLFPAMLRITNTSTVELCFWKSVMALSKFYVTSNFYIWLDYSGESRLLDIVFDSSLFLILGSFPIHYSRSVDSYPVFMSYTPLRIWKIIVSLSEKIQMHMYHLHMILGHMLILQSTRDLRNLCFGEIHLGDIKKTE